MEILIAPMSKSNQVEYPVAELIEQRRSRRAYSTNPIEHEKIKSLFEAARWAPSSMNEQPWTYVYATRDQPDLWNKLLELLNESNRVWAINAPLLIFSLARKTHMRNGANNALARYDTGAANTLLSIQATQLGLNVHQMGGYDRQKAIESLNIPEAYEPIVIMAIGYPGDPDSLSENLKLREEAPRERYTQEFFVMNKSF
ncbi:MAG TPA: nitroreductase family protein [Cyclobacteriaceae bacterium]|nr:nitroreductase family protein [Cyclobacteriaceae bacterium]